MGCSDWMEWLVHKLYYSDCRSCYDGYFSNYYNCVSFGISRIYDLSSYIDDTGSTVSYRNLEILANLNKNGKLRKLYLAENQNISDWSLLKNIKNWEEYTGW